MALSFTRLRNWPGRPGVFSKYTFGQTEPLVLYIGSSPPRRTEFFLDFTSPATGHYAPLNPFTTSDLAATTGQTVSRLLSYKTGSLNSIFIIHPSYIISERTLVKEFGAVDFCNGYIFVPGTHSVCHSGTPLISLTCGDSSLNNCDFHVTVYAQGKAFQSVPARISTTSKWHIFPLPQSTVWNSGQLPDSPVMHVLPTNSKENITIYTNRVEFTGDEIILSLWMLEASFRHLHKEGGVEIYKTIAEDDNTEALLYSLAIVFAFAYWVHVSREVSHFLYHGGTLMPPTASSGEVPSSIESKILDSIRDSIPSALIANISLSLAIASIFSSIPAFSHAHIFLPVEAYIIIGKYGDYYTSFWRFLYPIYQCLSSVIVLMGCLFIYGTNPNTSTESKLSLFFVRVYDIVFKDTNADYVCRYLLPALRYCFELQLLNAAFTTVPPPAGTAFRLTMSGFISIALQCIFGRDAVFIFNYKRKTASFNHFITCTLIFVVATIALFHNTVLMMAPLLWATNVVPLELSLGVSACFLTTLTAAAFVVALSSQRALSLKQDTTTIKKFY